MCVPVWFWLSLCTSHIEDEIGPHLCWYWRYCCLTQQHTFCLHSYITMVATLKLRWQDLSGDTHCHRRYSHPSANQHIDLPRFISPALYAYLTVIGLNYRIGGYANLSTATTRWVFWLLLVHFTDFQRRILRGYSVSRTWSVVCTFSALAHSHLLLY